MYTHCIIGAGATGLILLLLLAESKVPLESILIIDPYFDGGDLARKWSSVLSNTPWSATYSSLQKALPSYILPPTPWPLDKPTPVSEIARLLREIAKPLFHKVKMVQGYVTSATYQRDWSVEIKRESVKSSIHTRQLYCTIGSEPKLLDLPIPTIPLEIALDPNRLRQYIQPADKIILFGTSHSGVLALKNAIDCSGQVIAIYKGSKPFIFARDGEYDGLKLDGATYADDFLKGTPLVTLISNTNTSALIRETRSAQWVVYATGFEQRTIPITVNGETKLCSNYSATTGEIKDCPNAWGFGIAFPSQAPDGTPLSAVGTSSDSQVSTRHLTIHFDVGISSFIEHIQQQLPIILKDT